MLLIKLWLCSSTTVHLQCEQDIRDWHCWVWEQTSSSFSLPTKRWTDSWIRQKKNTVQSYQGSNLGLPIAGHTLWPLMEWSWQGRIFRFLSVLALWGTTKNVWAKLFCQTSFLSGHSRTGALIMKTQHRGIQCIMTAGKFQLCCNSNLKRIIWRRNLSCFRLQGKAVRCMWFCRCWNLRTILPCPDLLAAWSGQVCVCVTKKKKVPDEWQAWQATPAILQASSSKHNAKKITTRERGPFHQSITAILTEEKKRREAVY